MAGRLDASRHGGKPVGLAIRAGSQRIEPQRGVVPAPGDDDPRGAPPRARDGQSLHATATPRGGGAFRSSSIRPPTPPAGRARGVFGPGAPVCEALAASRIWASIPTGASAGRWGLFRLRAASNSTGVHGFLNR